MCIYFNNLGRIPIALASLLQIFKEQHRLSWSMGFAGQKGSWKLSKVQEIPTLLIPAAGHDSEPWICLRWLQKYEILSHLCILPRPSLIQIPLEKSVLPLSRFAHVSGGPQFLKLSFFMSCFFFQRTGRNSCSRDTHFCSESLRLFLCLEWNEKSQGQLLHSYLSI